MERLHPTNISEAGDIEGYDNVGGLWNMDKNLFKDINKTRGNQYKRKIQSRNIPNDGANTIYIELLKSRTEATGVYDFLNLMVIQAG